MKIAVLSGNPKTDGLCQSIIDAAKNSVEKAGVEADEIRLCDLDLGCCKVCGDGWGTCRDENYCSFGSDGYDEVVKQLADCDALIMATPVYWGESSEVLKSFIDRMRRCHFGQKGILSGKQVLLIASAGGTGNGLLSCLEQMERFCRHTGAAIFDYIGVNRWNCDYKLKAAKEAAYAMTVNEQL